RPLQTYMNVRYSSALRPDVAQVGPANRRRQGPRGSVNGCSAAALSSKIGHALSIRRGAGVADRAGLENRCRGNSTEGSNPSLSAPFCKKSYTTSGMRLCHLGPHNCALSAKDAGDSAVLQSLFLGCRSQDEMDDFRRGPGTQREPVTDAVGNDQGRPVVAGL